MKAILLILLASNTLNIAKARPHPIKTDLLIVGGTESGCAAAVQAARMGVKHITIVNDIHWLGGQFTAEALVAIDENRGPAGYDQTVPFPRNGLFKEVIDGIESLNRKKYGVARPGNTRVITTCRPADAERVFRELLAPYVKRGQITIHSHYEPTKVTVKDNRVQSVHFKHPTDKSPPLIVQAKLTIDASDWGDVIRLSGAAYEFGPDLKSKYQEPLAPAKRETHPITDMNPITYCMILEETDKYQLIAKPKNYDPRNYRSHKWPKDPLWLYASRRLVDHYHFKMINCPDALLLCFPAIDYPLDVHPQSLAKALEQTEKGASKKNIVQLTPAQRRLIFADAKQYSLGFLYYLQTEVHDSMPDKTHSFRRFNLSDEFGTPDHMPFKPYVRESLRMKTMMMLRQQDTMGVNNNARHFAKMMAHDGIAAWQFEYDFHPTKREFLIDGDTSGPWRCTFREGRKWGPPYSGRSVFPLRCLIPEKLDGLLGAQKNLGYTSIVSSAVRLHDQSMAIGQASGAAAAIALKYDVKPRTIVLDRARLVELQTQLASSLDGGQPSCLWPYRDLEPTDKAYPAINILAVQRCLPQFADEVDFRPEAKPSKEWMNEVVQLTQQQLKLSTTTVNPPFDSKSRADFVRQWWSMIRHQAWKPYTRQYVNMLNNNSLKLSPLSAKVDGIPDPLPSEYHLIKQFNFAGRGTPKVLGFITDHGQLYEKKRGHGWKRDISKNHRRRGKTSLLGDTFLFTRTHDIWECKLPKGEYQVTLSIGDSNHEQFGQNVTIEGKSLFRNHRTPHGRFAERSIDVKVEDGHLTVEIGLVDSKTNTCINWLRIAQQKD